MMDFTAGPPDRFTPIAELSRQAARPEVAAPRAAIAHHDRLYDVENAPAISDRAYDRLFERLDELEAAFKRLLAGETPSPAEGKGVS